MATKSVLSQSANLQSGSAQALGALMNKSAGSKSGRSSKPAADGEAQTPAPAASAPRSGGQDMTKSVLSQSAGMTSSSAQALGALAAKSSASKGGRSASQEPAPQSGGATAPTPVPTAKKAGPDMTKSVLSMSAGQTSSAAQALGALAAKQSSGRTSPQAADAPAAPAPAAPAAAARSAGPDMTKSVLSQSAGLTSSSAAALGALAAKSSSGRASPQPGSGRATPQAADPQTNVVAPPAPAATMSNLPGSERPTRPAGPDMTKSVLSMSDCQTSSAAQALGSLTSMQRRGAAASNQSAAPQSDDQGASTASNNRPAGPDMTKSVLSQATGFTSSSAQALGGLAALTAQSQGKGADQSGYPQGSAPGPAVGAGRIPTQDPIPPASPTRPDGMGMDMKIPNAVTSTAAVYTPLLHPDDAQPSSYKAGGSRLPVKSTWGWCSDMSEAARKPRGAYRPFLAHPDSEGPSERRLPMECHAVQVRCTGCAADLVEDVFGDS